MAGLVQCDLPLRWARVYSLWMLVYGVPLPLPIQRALGEFASRPKGHHHFIARDSKTKIQNAKGEIDSGKQAMRGFGSGGPISDRTQCGRTPGGPPPIDLSLIHI